MDTSRISRSMAGQAKYRDCSKPAALFVVLWWVFAVGGRAETSFHGSVRLEGAMADGPSSWRSGGFGRLDSGGDEESEQDDAGAEIAQLAFDWEPNLHFGAHVHVRARSDTPSRRGDAAGLVEAYAQVTVYPRAGHRLRFRLGSFFLPTSRENVEALWSSPYTTTFSAINSWIADEVRPTALATEYFWQPGQQQLTLGGAAIAGVDTAGTQLAWRGWSLGSVLAVYGETLPLAEISALDEDGLFGGQRDSGSEAFGRDLDGRLGWAAWAGWRIGSRVSFRVTRFDNRGDRGLHDDHYAWETDFTQLGLDLHSGPFALACERLEGSSGMGFSSRQVQVDMESWYLLASVGGPVWRGSLRYDDFGVDDRARAVGVESTDDDGSAWTAALSYSRGRFRTVLEAIDLDADREVPSEVDPDVSGRRLSLSLRWSF